jgi:hypothetical protein
MVEAVWGRAFFRALGMYSKICEEDRGVVATKVQGRWPSKPSWSSTESDGASETPFEGVMEPGSVVGAALLLLLVPVLVV